MLTVNLLKTFSLICPHLSSEAEAAKLCRRVFVSTLWGSAASFCGGPVVVLDEEPLSRMEPKF